MRLDPNDENNSLMSRILTAEQVANLDCSTLSTLENPDPKNSEFPIDKISRGDMDRTKDRERDRDREKDRDNRDRDRSRDRQREKERWRDKEIPKQEKVINKKDEDIEHARRFGMVSRPTMSPLEAMNIDETSLMSNASGRSIMEAISIEEIEDLDEDANKNETGLEKAMRMLKKKGWKEGEGLGKSKQGLKGCLVSVGPYNTLVTVQDPSPVLRIQNMADKGRVDPNLKVETIVECSKFGPVLECVVYESRREDVRPEQAVSVFVRFENINSASGAVSVFHGRSFDGRIVSASFFPLERYQKQDFDI